MILQGHLVYCGDAEALGKLVSGISNGWWFNYLDVLLFAFSQIRALAFVHMHASVSTVACEVVLLPSLFSVALQMEAWVPLGYPNERGFFWLRLVLMLLCLKRIDVAYDLLQHHSGVHWMDDEDIPAPLQVAYLLVAACKVKSIAAFNLLLRRYNVLLRRDPLFSRCADQIKLEVFGVTRQQPASLGSLFSSIFAAPSAGEEAA